MSELHVGFDVDLEPLGQPESRAVGLVAVSLTRDVAQELEMLTDVERARLAEDIRCDVDIAIGLSFALRARRLRERGVLAD